MTDSLWTTIKLVVMSFEPQWMFNMRLTRTMEEKVKEYYSSAGVHIDTRDFFGKEINNIKEWKRLMKAQQDMLTAMATVGGDANKPEEQEALGKWIADVVRIGNRAADIMDMLYPDQKDAPWRKS